MVYCWSLATFGSPLTVCMPPAACQVDPQVSSPRSIKSTSFQPALVRWYRTLHPTTPPPITTAFAWLFTNPPLSLVRNRQLHRSLRRRRRALAEALDEPGAEQCDRGVAQPVRMRRQVVAVAVIQGGIEGPHQAPVGKFLAEEVGVLERDPLATEGVLGGQHRGIKDQSALDVHAGEPVRAHELAPGVVARPVGDAHVHDLVLLDELGQRPAAMRGGD